MITDKLGDAATEEIERWAGTLVRSLDQRAGVSVYHDADSSTYVVRLARANRVLLFRFSEAQVLTASREKECEKIVKEKLRDL
ncbi:MAG TPA: hypothetical protein VGL11_10735 [Candidatus Binatia bacterium]|jgi:hypothetical protein